MGFAICSEPAAELELGVGWLEPCTNVGASLVVCWLCESLDVGVTLALALALVLILELSSLSSEVKLELLLRPVDEVSLVERNPVKEGTSVSVSRINDVSSFPARVVMTSNEVALSAHP